MRLPNQMRPLFWPVLMAIAGTALVATAIWCILPPAPRATFPRFSGKVHLAPDGSFLVSETWDATNRSTSYDGQATIRLMRPRDSVITVLPPPNERVKCVAISPGGRRIAVLLWGGGKKHLTERLCVLDVRNGHAEKLKTPRDELTWWYQELAYNENGQLLSIRSSPGEQKCEVWDAEARMPWWEVKCPVWWWAGSSQWLPKEGFRVRPDDNIEEMARLVGRSRHVILHDNHRTNPLWDPTQQHILVSADGRTVAHFAGPLDDGMVWGIPGAIANTAKNTWTIWDVRSGKCRAVQLDQATDLSTFSTNVYLSPDGRWLAMTRIISYGAVTPWYVRVVQSIGLPPLISSGVHRELCLFDLRNGNAIFRRRLDDPILMGVALDEQRIDAEFSQDGRTLAVTLKDRVELWDVPPRKPWGKIGLFSAATFLAFLFPALGISWFLRGRRRNSPAKGD